MLKARVAITSASSFTGLWIANAFHGAGWDVHALCQSRREEYTGLRAHRLSLLETWAQVHYGVGITDKGMEKWIAANSPEIWIHHHHFMEEFRSPKYDVERARKVGLDPLPGIVQALDRIGCRGVVFSGSYFEPGEGGSPIDDPSATPYSQSKREVWLALQKECAASSLSLSKVVIPNPVGPFENEDRLIPRMIQNARDGSSLRVTTPAAMGDQIPVTALADRYLEVAEDLLGGRSRVLRPSGWYVSVRDFLNAINAELIVKRLRLPKVALEISENPAPSKNSRNSEPAEIDWDAAWDHYAHWLRKKD